MEFEKSSPNKDGDLYPNGNDLAQSERFELPSHGDTGFQIRRNTRLCDDCFIGGGRFPSFSPFARSVSQDVPLYEVHR